MRHYLNATKTCDCLKCNRQANEEEKEETDEEKKKEKELESLKAELRGKSHEELDKIKEDLIAQIEELKKDKTETKEAKRKRYDVLGYQQMNFDSQCGDELMESLGSTD